VERSRQGGLGTRAVLSWDSIYPALGPEGEESVLLAGEAPTGEDLTPDFYRGRTWERRNACGIQGQRPGRDVGMPSFRARVGAGSASR
jgi:recombination protein RecA